MLELQLFVAFNWINLIVRSHANGNEDPMTQLENGKLKKFFIIFGLCHGKVALHIQFHRAYTDVN
jgi:hypothetical protein